MLEPRSLTERIEELRAELDEHIEAMAAKEADRYPGVPKGVLRNLITKGNACPCRVVLATEKKRIELARQIEN